MGMVLSEVGKQNPSRRWCIQTQQRQMRPISETETLQMANHGVSHAGRDVPGHRASGVQKLSSGQGKTGRKEIWISVEPGG